MPFDFIFAHSSLELSFPPDLFTSSVIYHFIWCTVLFNKLVQSFVNILLYLDWLCLHEKVFVDKYLQVLILMYQLEPCIYGVGWHSFFHVFAAHQKFGRLYIFKQVAWEPIWLAFALLLWGLGLISLGSNPIVHLGPPESCSSVSLVIGKLLASLYLVRCPLVLGTRPPDLGRTILTSFTLLGLYLLLY